MAKHSRWNILATGLALFSMFFGAGNIVFPMALGQYAGDKVIFPIIGLLVTAVGVPFLGLISMVLFEGNYRRFFSMLGRIPGFLVIAFLVILNGPIGPIPRCVTLSYAALGHYFPGLSLFYFSLILCVIMFFITARKNKVVGILGKVLSPILVVILIVMIIKGLAGTHDIAITGYAPWSLFTLGLCEGYLTMDLLGSLFFSAMVFASFKKTLIEQDHKAENSDIMKYTAKASCIGAFLLGAIYVGFSYVASYHGYGLDGVDKDKILTIIAERVLGPFGSFFVNIAVLFACLTTAVTLAVVFAEFLQKQIFRNKVNYILSLLFTLVVTFIFSNLGFMGIINMISPILQVVYPVLIVLTVFNILHRVAGITFVKVPVWLTCFILFLAYFSR